MECLPEDELKKLQAVLLDILKVIDEFCRANDIAYFLDSGTALGAVRHGGFIPWDDDVDLGMLREDYDRFIELAAEGLPEGYSLHTYENTPGFAGMFAKVYRDGTVFETKETRAAGCPQCVFVDIFPYDVLSSDAGERTRQLRAANFWQKASYLYHSPYVTLPVSGFAGAVVKTCCFAAHGLFRLVLSRKRIRAGFEKSRVFASDPSSDRTIMAYSACGVFGEELLSHLEPRAFEGCQFMAMVDVVEYLGIVYGQSWAELPPVEQRRTHKPLKLVLE